MQLDNENGGAYEYLGVLKQMAIDAGFDVPFYSKTQWPIEPQPAGALLPFAGGYADGFWNSELTPVSNRAACATRPTSCCTGT